MSEKNKIFNDDYEKTQETTTTKKWQEISSNIDKAYSGINQKSEVSSYAKEDKGKIMSTQKDLNNHGYTDMQGNMLKVDGIWGKKTNDAFDKALVHNEQIARPSEDTKNLQKSLNKYEVKDKNGNALKEDGVLGPLTDSAVQKAIRSAKDFQPEPTKYSYEVDDASNKYIDDDSFEAKPNNEYASLHDDPEFKKVLEESIEKNIEIKNSPIDKYNAKFDYLLQDKVTDEQVLDEWDMEKIKILKAMYQYFIDNGDQVSADAAHHAANKIRSAEKYKNTGYGPSYRDNYNYSDGFNPDEHHYYEVRSPIDTIETALLHSDLGDEFVGSGASSIGLNSFGSMAGIPPQYVMALDIISQLISGTGDGFSKYVQSVEIGDIPVLLNGNEYYYRPSDGTIIKG